jgi:WD40 repeat protein
VPKGAVNAYGRFRGIAIRSPSRTSRSISYRRHSIGPLRSGDTYSGQCLQTLQGRSDSVSSVTFSHRSKCLASASYEKTVEIWEIGSGQCLQTFEGHRNLVLSVAFSHDWKSLASASSDKTVRIRGTASGQCTQTLAECRSSVNSVAFAYDSKYLASH